MADQFDSLVYALSSLRRDKDDAPAPCARIEKAERKYLDLLDDIALLLVTGGKGDVAAVTYHQTPTSLSFYYSKNAPCNGALETYLAAIQKAFVSNEDLDQMQYDITWEMLANCTEKFGNRIAKCNNAIEDYEGRHGEVRPNVDMESRKLSDYVKDGKGVRDIQIVNDFLSDLLYCHPRIPGSEGDIDQQIVLSQKAYAIGNTDYMSGYPMLPGIQKIGEYFGAPMRIRNLFKDPVLFKLRDTIQFHEIPPPSPKALQLPCSMVEIFNNHARKHDLEELAIEDISAKYSYRKLAEKGSRSVTVSTHCELTLALHALQQPSTSKRFPIGVSKRSCWLSQHFLESLAGDTNCRGLISENQQGNKIHSGWAIPPGTPDTVSQAMRELVEREICDVRRSIIVARRRRVTISKEKRASLNEQDGWSIMSNSQIRCRHG